MQGNCSKLTDISGYQSCKLGSKDQCFSISEKVRIGVSEKALLGFCV